MSEEEIKQENPIEEIQNEIEELKNKKKMLTKEEKKKAKENNKLRLKSNNNRKSNTLIRVSNNLAIKIVLINDKREENGFDEMSGPKITDLITRHKLWNKIQQDIIHFNTALDSNEVEEFNDEK